MGFWKWLFTGRWEDTKATLKKPVSLGLGFELKRIFGLIETIDEKKAKLKRLKSERRILKDMISEFDKIEDKVEHDAKRFKNNIKKLELILNTIHDYHGRLKKIDKTMDKLSDDIKTRAKQTETDITELKEQAAAFREVEDKIDEQKRRIREELEAISDKIKKEKKSKAKGYSAVLVGPVDLEKVKRPVVKEVVKQERPSIEVTTNVVMPEEGKKKPKKPRKPKRIAKVEESKQRALKKKSEKKIEFVEEDVVDTALSEGVEEEEVYESQEYKEPKAKVETEIDQVLALVRKKGKVSFSKLAKKFDEKTATIEEWAEALEDKGFIQIVYPLIGSPYMKLRK